MFSGEMVPRCFTAGDLVFYAYDNRIFRDGSDIHASNREYQILCCLAMRMHSDDTVVLREDIQQQLYAGKAHCEKVVDVFFSRIRKKLKDLHSTVSIETVHGKGYTMVVSKPTMPPAPSS